MKVLTGTDIIEINRIEKSIETLGDVFKNKILFLQKPELVF